MATINVIGESDNFGWSSYCQSENGEIVTDSYYPVCSTPSQDEKIITDSDYLATNYPPLSRLASFITLNPTAYSVSFAKLAEAGFECSRKGLVKCEGCGNALPITHFTSSPVEEKYHWHGCEFVERGRIFQEPAIELTMDSLAGNNMLGKQYEWGASPILNDKVQLVNNPMPDCKNESNPLQSHLANLDLNYDSALGQGIISQHKESPGKECSASNTTNQNSPTASGLSCDNRPVTQQQGNQSSPSNKFQHHHPSSSEKQDLPHPEQTQTSSILSSGSNQCQGTSNDNLVPTALGPEREKLASGSSSTLNHVSSVENNRELKDSSQANRCEKEDYAPILYTDVYDLKEFQPEFETGCQDAKASRLACKKNPGHYAHFPIGKFELDYIPSNARTPEVKKLFEVIADLTVKITVGTISKARPAFDFLNLHHTKGQIGTGMAIVWNDEEDQSFNAQHPGKWSVLKKCWNRKKGFLNIMTHRHLVFDKMEAESAKVDFFYNTSNQKGIVTAKGVTVLHSKHLSDCTSILQCETHDLNLIKMVKNLTHEMDTLMKKLPRKIKEGLMKRVFLISHAHGGEKVFSYGEYVLVKYVLKTDDTAEAENCTTLVKINKRTQISNNPEEVRKVLLYTADTCCGSSGAAVIAFKKTGSGDSEDIVIDLWVHYGVDRKTGLNASTMKVLTHEDVASHGKTTSYRPALQEEMNEEADRAANQVLQYPVYIVFKPPTHPAYVTYRKRLESYPVPFNHVHSPVDLADAGFFYANYADCVRCFQCGIGLKSWKPGDVIHKEHGKNRPDCPFLLTKLRASGITGLEFQSHAQQSSARPQEAQATSGQESGLSVQSATTGQLASLPANQERTPTFVGEMQAAQSHAGNRSAQNVQARVEAVEQENLRTSTQEQWKLPKDMLQGTFKPSAQEITVAPCHVSSTQKSALPNTSASSVVNILEQVNILEREQEYLKQLLICKVCYNKPIKDLFLPCGELVACVECSKLLTHCPLCNKKILATVTTYFS